MFYHIWETLTQDPWVLETVRGFKIDFIDTPAQTYLPKVLTLPEDQQKIVEEIASMLQKGAILEVLWILKRFVSILFLVGDQS